MVISLVGNFGLKLFKICPYFALPLSSRQLQHLPRSKQLSGHALSYQNILPSLSSSQNNNLLTFQLRESSKVSSLTVETIIWHHSSKSILGLCSLFYCNGVILGFIGFQNWEKDKGALWANCSVMENGGTWIRAALSFIYFFQFSSYFDKLFDMNSFSFCFFANDILLLRHE